jgi:hypothetical protein
VELERLANMLAERLNRDCGKDEDVATRQRRLQL